MTASCQRKQFRQLDSITPGHPEVGVTPGIEVTTGPLGQGFANAVGLAIAQAHLGATFNKENFSLFDNYTYMFTGDGCLMEGVSSEAASLAGHLKLGNLIAIYDDNQISIDGSTAIAFTEDVSKRFEAYDWQVLHVENGNEDLEGMYKAIEEARAEKHKPTLIVLRTTIGYGSRDQGTHSVHGNPLKADDTVQIKKKFGFNPEEYFVVPDEVRSMYASYAKRGAEHEQKWQALHKEYESKFPEEAADIARRIEGKLPTGWEKALPEFKPTDDAVATRKLSEMILAKLSTVVPELVSGSADLTPSNLTRWKNAVDFQPKETGLGDYTGRYIVRFETPLSFADLHPLTCAILCSATVSASTAWALSRTALRHTAVTSWSRRSVPSSTLSRTLPALSASLLSRTSASSGSPPTTRCVLPSLSPVL